MVYTAPSVGNFNACPYRCADGFFLNQAGQCVTCQTNPCPIGQYRQGCNQTSAGSCVSCTSWGPSNNEDTATYTSAGTPFDQNTCTFQCDTGNYLRSDGVCTAIQGMPGNNCPLGQKYISSLVCTTCSGVGEVAPVNAAYTYAGLCAWSCNSGFYKSGPSSCTPCSNKATKCTRGTYVSRECGGESDVVCSPCRDLTDARYSFPPSMDAVATYRLQKKANDFTKESMCVWDCNAGYYKAEGTVAACVRCVNKPLDAEYIQVSTTLFQLHAASYM